MNANATNGENAPAPAPETTQPAPAQAQTLAQKRDGERAEARAKKEATKRDWWARLEAEIVAFAGRTVEKNKHGEITRVDGEWAHVELREQDSHAMMSRFVGTGAFRAIVGDYGDRTTFPPCKDGWPNTAKIAAKLLADSQARKSKRAAEARAKTGYDANLAEMAKIVAEVNGAWPGTISEYGSISNGIGRIEATSIGIKVTASINGDAAKARTFLAALRAAGLI